MYISGKNKLIAGILAFLVVLSVGYAVFSDTIVINGTAQGKGQFKFEYTCQVVTSDREQMSDGTYKTSLKSSGEGECTIENGVIKTVSNLSKPTDTVNFHITVYNHDNNNTAAKLVSVDSPNNLTFQGTAGDSLYGDFSKGLAAYYTVYEKDGRTNTGKTYSSDSSLLNAGLILGNDQMMDIIITHQWVDMTQLGVAQPVLPEGGATLTYNVSFGLQQYTGN